MTDSPNDLERRLAAIRTLIFDVDGVLTDGRLALSSSGDESKSFNIRDGLGIVLAQQAGLRVALLSGRRSAAVDRRAADLGIPADLVLSGERDKGRALRLLKERLDLPQAAVAFVGDDLNDLPAFAESGVRVAVADAARELVEAADLTTTRPGGCGAAREIIERILKAQGRWDISIECYLAFLQGEIPPDRSAPH